MKANVTRRVAVVVLAASLMLGAFALIAMAFDPPPPPGVALDATMSFEAAPLWIPVSDNSGAVVGYASRDDVFGAPNQGSANIVVYTTPGSLIVAGCMTEAGFVPGSSC